MNAAEPRFSLSSCAASMLLGCYDPVPSSSHQDLKTQPECPETRVFLRSAFSSQIYFPMILLQESRYRQVIEIV